MHQHGEAGYGVERLASRNRKTAFAAIWKHRSLYALAVLPVLWFLVFRYLPLFNAQIAFKQYFPMEGVLKSPWIGFGNILYFINSPNFGKIMFNTLFYSFAKLVIGLPLAVMLALAIYESAFPLFRKAVQMMSYLPHFLSWIIVYGILTILLSQGGGLVNQIIKSLGGTEMDFLGNSRTFPWVVILSDAWKEMGWSAIIFLAALMAINPCLYEAADIEGANRARGARVAAAFVYGLPEMPVANLSLRDYSVSMAEGCDETIPAEMADGLPDMCRHGIWIRNVDGLSLNAIHIEGFNGKAIDVDTSVRMADP